MSRIKVLEPNIANKIAAGEVVERPASVVKELVENSIDAGSTAITVEIRNGGIDYIRITDNGSGIDPEDSEKAFLRHATSKLASASDLDHIETLGFRGEALASIAAVSKLTMRTRTECGEYGTKLLIEGGKIISNEPCGCPCGTTIEVSELFYNVPARLKFLKSARGESAMIGDYITRLILANPKVAIKFINNGKSVYHSSGDGSLENALFCVYGSEISARLYRIDYDDGYLKLTGYVGNESLAKSTRTQQSLFINHRYIKSVIVSNSVQRAFDTRLMHGKFPFFVMDMLISSYEIDVNVHPNKLSIRFKDDERIGFAVTRAINEAIGEIVQTPVLLKGELHAAKHCDEPRIGGEKNDVISLEKLCEVFSIEKAENIAEKTNHQDFNTQSADSTITLSQSDDRGYAADASVSSSCGLIISNERKLEPIEFRDSGADSVPAFDYKPHNINSNVPKHENIPRFDLTPNKRDQSIGVPEQIRLCDSPYTIIGAAFDTYIIIQQDDALFYIDQHAAHERMLYEKLIHDELRFDSQILLVPADIHLDPIHFEVLTDNIARFEELGFSLELVSDMTARIAAVTSMLSTNYEGFIDDAISAIIDNGRVTEVDLIRAELIKASCKKAVKAGDRLEPAEIEEILKAYIDGNTPLTCPHGRPVIIKVTKFELQKRFKRIL